MKSGSNKGVSVFQGYRRKRHLFEGLPRNFPIVLCVHFECNVALHVDTTTSTNSTYKISQESAEDISEDPINVAEDLTEAPNQSSENSDTPAPNPTQEGKPRT
jgi:hypothetical protein